MSIFVRNTKKQFEVPEKGSSLLLIAIIFTALLLSVGIGLGGFLRGELQLLEGVGNSIAALSAADAGIEHVLYLDIKNCPNSGTMFSCSDPDKSCYPDCVKECVDTGTGTDGDCIITIDADPPIALPNLAGTSYELTPIKDPGEPECTTQNYCAQSIGSFKDARREIQIER